MRINKKIVTIVLLAFSLVGFKAYALEWNVSLWGKQRAFTENVEKLADLVEQKTQGRFKLNISYGGLSKSRENLDGIAIGAFEMAQFCSFYHADKNPSITVVELPYSKKLSLTKITEIYNKIHKHPIVVRDLARWNATILMPTPLPQYNLVGKGSSVKSLLDFDGKRIRGPGGILSVLSKFGAIKTSVPFSEVRQSMNSGVIDAASFAPHAHLAAKTYKIGKWATTNLNLGSANCPVVVNTDALAELTPEFRRVLLGSVDEALAYYIDNYDNKIVGKYQKELDKTGLEQIIFSNAQTEDLANLSVSVRKDWVKKYKNKFNSQQLFDYANGLFNQ